MGIIYDRNKDHPDRGPNIWIKYQNQNGKWQYASIGHVNAKGLTKAQLKAKKKNFHQLASNILTKIEGDVVAGQYGLEDRTKSQINKRLFDEVAQEWVQRRKEANRCDPNVHRAWRDDKCRVNKHLRPFFKQMTIGGIQIPEVKRFIRTKQGELARQTIVHCLSLLSRLYNDLREEYGTAVVNPVAQLDRVTRKAIGPKRDPQKTPFLRDKKYIRALHLSLQQPFQIMYDVGVFAGLRTGEIQALEADDIDLNRRRILVTRSVNGPLKDNDTRVVPILDSLFPVLRDWIMAHSGQGPLFPPTSGSGKYIRKHTMYKHLKKALKDCKLPEELTWYQCTRHTFASHWIMDDRSIEKLQQVMGHSSIMVTQRYAHLCPEMFTEKDLAAIKVDLNEPVVIPIRVQK